MEIALREPQSTSPKITLRRLDVLCVVQTLSSVPPMTPRAGDAESTILRERLEHAEKEAETYVNSVVAEAKNAGVSLAVGTVVRASGSPAIAITETAKREGARSDRCRHARAGSFRENPSGKCLRWSCRKL